MQSGANIVVKDWWLDAIDRLMERYTSQGYKGAERIFEYTGDSNNRMRLPSIPDEVTEVTEDDEVLDDSEYYISNKKYLCRNQSFLSTGRWLKGVRYKVTYTEPDFEADAELLPDEWRLCAAECVSIVVSWAKKRKQFGSALTATESGDAGKVASSTSFSFPSSVGEELKRTIQNLLRRDSF